jgi:hypothetical protein
LIDSPANHIFLEGKITVERLKRKRVMLEVDGAKLPFMAWSSGQKEFFPLAMAFDMLAALKRRQQSEIKYVIVEEPEMGLHPRAISSVILQILDLIKRGHKIIVSTHSPVLLEFAWAFNILKQENASLKNFDALFNLVVDGGKGTFFTDELIRKSINTYYFKREKIGGPVKVKDISSLDAGNEDTDISEFGDLSFFASKAGEIVSSIVASK